jgi:F-type H+-transporting ATPase subunit gamma
MQTIEGLKRTIGSTRDLQSLVKTMKAMAAVNIRQYEKALASLRIYDRTIKMGFRGICRGRPPVPATPGASAGGRRGAVVFGSDQGMCGSLNEQVVSFTLQTLKHRAGDAGSTVLMAVGERVPGLLEDSGYPVESVMSLPASVAGITAAVQDILLQIDDWHEMAGIGQVTLFFSRQLSGMSCRPHALALLPVDPEAIGTGENTRWPGRSLPAYTMDWAPLFSSLVRHYLFVSLFRAFAETMASENASRLVAMQGAEKNIDERLAELNAQFHQQRQMSITEELLDIVAGFEALNA